jgi:mono/diheme cytochrome c family protein
MIWKRLLGAVVILGAIGAAAGWILTAPRPMTAAALPQHTADAKNGEQLYNAGGCISCHKPDKADTAADPKIPSGGMAFKTPAGTLYPPNLTPDTETGIGIWNDLDFVNAMKLGISPGGEHYIPAFPYASYTRMKTEDVLDIKAYLATLPAVKSPRKSGLPLEFFVRRGTGLWKLVGLDTTPWAEDANQTPAWNRGSYLVNGPGHCAECHTPRNLFMATDRSRHLMGGPHPEDSKVKVPSLRNLLAGQCYKSAKDLVFAFQYGNETDECSLSAAGMASVQTNLSYLPEADQAAIAEYLTSLK